MKKCTLCNETKDLSEFYVINKNPNRLTARCRKCTNIKTMEWAKTDSGKASHDKSRKLWVDGNKEHRKNYELNRAYGISLDDYNEMRVKQNYSCAVCGKHETEAVRKMLYVDHCHTTNKVRGLLCSVCNKALGLFKDNPEFLLRAVSYLKEKQHGK